MAFREGEKTEIIEKFARSNGDDGSAAVQVAVITHRLKYLQEHFKKHHKDNHSRNGLLKMVGRRRRLMKYIKRRNPGEYRELLSRLGLRK